MGCSQVTFGYCKEMYAHLTTLFRFMFVHACCTVMRLGKPLEHMQAALKVLNSDNARTAEQTTTLLRQLGYAAYLIFDAVVWVSIT